MTIYTHEKLDETRRGTCPACLRDILCTPEGRLIKHGWEEIPIAGQKRTVGDTDNVTHEGTCPGVDRHPIEYTNLDAEVFNETDLAMAAEYERRARHHRGHGNAAYHVAKEFHTADSDWFKQALDTHGIIYTETPFTLRGYRLRDGQKGARFYVEVKRGQSLPRQCEDSLPPPDSYQGYDWLREEAAKAEDEKARTARMRRDSRAELVELCRREPSRGFPHVPGGARIHFKTFYMRFTEGKHLKSGIDTTERRDIVACKGYKARTSNMYTTENRREVTCKTCLKSEHYKNPSESEENSEDE